MITWLDRKKEKQKNKNISKWERKEVYRDRKERWNHRVTKEERRQVRDGNLLGRWFILMDRGAAPPSGCWESCMHVRNTHTHTQHFI